MNKNTIEYSGLLRFCGKPLSRSGTESSEGLFEYAEKQASQLLSSAVSLKSFSELHADVYEAVFSGKKSVADLTRKRFGKRCTPLVFRHLERCVFLNEASRGKVISVSSIEKLPDNSIRISPPKRLSPELVNIRDRYSEKISRKLRRAAKKASPLNEKLAKRSLAPLKMRLIRSLMLSAANDRRFIARYNEETFFKDIVIGKKALNEADIYFIFNGDSANRILNLHQKPVRTAIAVLYAMTEHGFSLRDIYSVGSIFSDDISSRSRENEHKRSKATAELISLLQYGKSDEIFEAAVKMGRQLLVIELPALDLTEVTTLAENYTLYAGAANIGAAFIAATASGKAELQKRLGADGESVFAAALLLSGYSKAVKLCDSLAAREAYSQVSLEETEGFAQVLELKQALDSSKKV